MFRKFVSALCICFMLTSCAANHLGVQTTLNKCGIGKAKYAEFQECCHQNIKTATTDTNDYYSKSRLTILNEVDDYGRLIKKKKMTQKTAYEYLNASMQHKIQEEQQQGQTAGAIVAAMILGVAVASCANTGSCGGGQSFANDDRGCCSWHNGMSGMCQAGRVLCNDGQLSPSCTC